MNQKVSLGIFFAIVLAALGMWYLSPSSTVNQITTTPETPAPTSTAPVTSVKPTTSAPNSTFQSIFTQSGNHECKYESFDGASRISGLIYISGGKMRGEFRTTGATSTSNMMVYNGGYLYTWKEGMGVGKKTSIKSVADLPAIIPADLTSGAIYGTASTNVGWDCHDWLTDPALLTVPTYVKFS